MECLRTLHCTRSPPSEECLSTANPNSPYSGCQVQIQTQEGTKESPSSRSCKATDRSTHFMMATTRSAPEQQLLQENRTVIPRAQGKTPPSGRVTVNTTRNPSWWPGPLRLRSPGNVVGEVNTMGFVTPQSNAVAAVLHRLHHEKYCLPVSLSHIYFHRYPCKNGTCTGLNHR